MSHWLICENNEFHEWKENDLYINVYHKQSLLNNMS